ATARLAFCWPMMYLSSSATICRGVRWPVSFSAAGPADSATSPGIRKTMAPGSSEFLDPDAVVGVDVDSGRDRERLPGELGRRKRRVLGERPGCGERVRPARSDGEQALVGSDQVAGPRDQQGELAVGDDQQRLELAQDLVGPPFARELDRGAFEVSAVFLE